jgi:hypothetical protein
MKIDIIGSNSRLYRRCASEISRAFEVREFSHLQLCDQTEFSNPIIFALAPTIDDNDAMLDMVAKKASGRLIYISSIAAIAAEKGTRYRYPSLKFAGENRCKRYAHLDVTVVRIGLVPDEHGNISGVIGKAKVTTLRRLVGAISSIAETRGQVGLRVLDATELVVLSDRRWVVRLVNVMYRGICTAVPLRLMWIIRPIDLLARVVGFRNYGYTYIANEYS